MTTMQPPRDGCTNCGAPVRTYKPVWGWVCSRCYRLLTPPVIRRGLSRS